MSVYTRIVPPALAKDLQIIGFPQSPVRPRRLRKGDITHIRAGFISVENPPEEKGHWICENPHIKEYVFIKDTAKRFDGIISWRDEPKLVKMGFVIEVE